MVSVDAFTQALIGFIQTYGYLALFVFIVLETAWIIHFAPSEVIIPVAAAYLVTTPEEFALFVAVGTVGAVIGSLLAYYLFGVNGDRVLQRYGHVLRVPESEVERSKAWFRRWGEGLMFWGRVVPVLRTPISVPAGFARMSVRTFTVYSFGGWAIYNAALVWLVYAEAGERAPIDYVIEPLGRAAESSPTLLAAVGLVACLGGAAWWWRRRQAV
ncbi:DedA family protein [Salinigranum halophilum]|uniref:DedA family protein n=1 Tax=Salinigranum halophilum TaxID=2565931 RepID=UPI00115EC61D|nr:DedA family protein [Salinigranum halophilum]